MRTEREAKERFEKERKTVKMQIEASKRQLEEAKEKEAALDRMEREEADARRLAAEEQTRIEAERIKQERILEEQRQKWEEAHRLAEEIRRTKEAAAAE